MVLKYKNLAYFFLSTLLLLSNATGLMAQEELKGPYLGQTPPGMEAELFAPGIISTHAKERDIAMTPDGKEIYFCRQLGNYSNIMVVKQVNGVWTKPEFASFSGKYDDIEPAISPDGKRFYFVSQRPKTAGGEMAKDWDIWFAERKGDSWGEPQNLGAPVNTAANQFFPSVTNDGSLYFNSRTPQGEFIFRSQFKDGKFQEPVKLPKEINAVRFQFNAFVAPDESYIIIPSGARKGAIGPVDYYICFRKEDGSWTQSINMGPQLNTRTQFEYSPFVSRDGKYLFFLSDRLGQEAHEFAKNRSAAKLMEISGKAGNGSFDIYWIDAAIIDQLRP